MDTLFTVLHVVGAVFIVGPMAILPMTAMRALRSENYAQVATLAKSTAVFSYLSLIVFVLGFAVLGMSAPKDNLSFTTPWILISVIAYAVAIVLSLVVVVPAMRRAAEAPAGPSSGSPAAPRSNAAVSAGSGVVSLLLLLVVVLMVWKP
ncbi:MAG: hypothetical protein QOI70_815 [Microbacteriaceae bacterium]|jgi:uncharacterized membrane protein|nr:hypothetical protein [Microbacteriaceae bacterium]